MKSEIKYNYINSPGGLVSLMVDDGSSENFYYAYTDHLGSILKTTDDDDNTLNEQSFDAWGRRRNPTDWTYSSIPNTPTWLSRGYTGHETLKEFNLINMNGRLYDPLVGQMLGTDPALQNPFNSQNYNKYSYVLNNPMKYTDPTGWYVVNNIDDPNFGQLTGHLDAKFSNWNDYTSYVKQELQMADMKLLQLDRVTVTKDAYIQIGGYKRLDSEGSIRYHFKTIDGGHYVRSVANNLPRKQGNEDYTQVLNTWSEINESLQPLDIFNSIVNSSAQAAGTTISTTNAFSRKELSATLTTAKLAKYSGLASRAFVGSQLLYSTSVLISDPTWGNFARLGVQASIFGVQHGANLLLPGSGLIIGFGLGALEAEYGDKLYNYIDKKR